MPQTDLPHSRQGLEHNPLVCLLQCSSKQQALLGNTEEKSQTGIMHCLDGAAGEATASLPAAELSGHQFAARPPSKRADAMVVCQAIACVDCKLQEMPAGSGFCCVWACPLEVPCS